MQGDLKYASGGGGRIGKMHVSENRENLLYGKWREGLQVSPIIKFHTGACYSGKFERAKVSCSFVCLPPSLHHTSLSFHTLNHVGIPLSLFLSLEDILSV